MSVAEEDPEDKTDPEQADESTEPSDHSMPKFWEIPLPETPLIPPHIFDTAAFGLSASLLETVRKVMESQTNQIQAMFSTLPRLDFFSLFPPASSNLASQISKAFEIPNRAFLDSLGPAANFAALRIDVDNPLSHLVKSLKIPNNLGNLLPKWFSSELLDQIGAWLQIGRPQNWDDSIDDEAAGSLAAAGWPIVWVPRASIVAGLVDAEDDDARRQLLVEHADQIFDDCDAALDAIESEELHLLRRLAREAVKAARQDLLGAAQATAAVVSDTSCHDFWGMERNGDILSNANPDIDEVPIRGLLKVLCLAIIAAAFATFRPEDGDPVPHEYNRHATIHRASEPQYSKANALQAIMTAVIAVCQIDHEIARRDPQGGNGEAAA